MVITDLKSNNKKYSIIYADPPWEQKKGGKKAARPNSSGKDLDYPTMSLNDIKNILQQVKTDEKHNFFIWTIEKYLFQTEKMMHDLGYSLHARIIWDKVTGIPAAFTIRYQHEYLLWCYKKGNIIKPVKAEQGKWADVFSEKVKKHSQKPEHVYNMIESMFPNTEKIELFARNIREGWDSWGNEVN